MNIVTEVAGRIGIGTLHASALKRLLPGPLYQMGMQLWIDEKFPRHLFLETTASCNLACGYCPREARRDHMAWSLFTAVVDEATRYGPRSFSLHLFGEPTLYPQWTAAIAYIKRAHPRHTVLLTTNGTTLNRRVDDLIRADPSLVLWSWRPEARFTPETKAKLRRWGKFRVRFITEVTPKEAYAEWVDWPNVEGRRIHNYGGNVDLAPYGSPTNPSPSSASTATSTSRKPPRWPCYHLWLAPAVAWNGRILICCADPHQKEVLGTFPQTTVAQAWQGERLRSIREGHLQGDYRGICANCDVWKQYPDLFFPWQKSHS